MRRLLLLVLTLFGLSLGLASPVAANTLTTDDPRVEVIEVGGLLDDATLRFLIGAIEDAADNDREVAIIQLNSPGAIASLELLREAADLLAEPPLPLVVWLGPAPAVAGGGAAQLLVGSAEVAAAPGTSIENWDPAIAATTESLTSQPDGLDLPLTVESADGQLIDRLAPSIRQLIQDLDGESFSVDGQTITLSTIMEVDDGEGVTTIPVSFTQPGALHRFLHLAARPEASFFFLTLALSVAAFEFYAVGPGLAAGAAAISFLLASFGLSILPINWWALAATLGSIWILTVSHQKGGILGLTVLGSAVLLWGGLAISAGGPQVRSGVFGVIFSVLAVLFFYLLALPTVGRARFSTQTIGREGLMSKPGRAVTDFGPDGVVEIDGARWPATAHRESGIKAGVEVVVVAVRGLRVEVEPGREN